MEIAFFSDSYLPTNDGVAHVVSALARALQDRGHGIRVFAPHPVKGEAPKEEIVEGIRVIRARSVPVPLYGEYRWAVFPFPQLRGQGFGTEIDVVHLHTPGIMGSTAFLTARRFDRPLVGTFHTNVWAMRESFPTTALTRLFFRAAWWYTLGTYTRCDATTAPTPEAAETLSGASRKPFPRPIEVVPNGIEMDRFRPGIERPDWRTRCGLPDAPLVTYLGRLTEDKGIHRFLDAVERAGATRRIAAIVGGTGPEEERVRERLRNGRLADSARYIGPVAEEEKPALLGQSDVFVLPSISDTSSLALLEAMACGAAPLASDRGGLPAIVADGRTGRIAPLEPPDALAGALGELLDDPTGRRRLGAAARAWVLANASIDGMAGRFISLYERLLSGEEPSARFRAHRLGEPRPLGAPTG